MIKPAAISLSIVDIPHPPLEVLLPFSLPEPSERIAYRNRLNYRKINFNELACFLRNHDWTDVTNADNVNVAVSHFTKIITDWLHENVPLTRPPPKPPWSNSTLRRSKREKNKCLKKYHRRRCPLSRQRFIEASRYYQRVNASCYRSYVFRTQSNLRKRPKSFWNFVNSKRKDNGLPASMFLNESSASSLNDKVNLFASHFASVFNNAPPPSRAEIDDATSNVPLDAVDIDVFTVSDEMIVAAINKLKSTYSAGPDGIPSVILKKCGAELLAPLSAIFNKSLSSGTFPDEWKKSFMFPIYKKGCKRDVANYRGITSLSSTSKLLEIVVHNYLFFYCKQYLSFDQHGFYPGRSVDTNLLEFTSFCLNQMENRLQVDAVYTDFKAAFDKIDHELFLAKFSKLGASNNFASWMRSYLSGRSLQVKVGDCASRLFSNSSGVPQGSNLGPLIFALFINDVCILLPEGCRLLYADDLKIFLAVKNIESCRLLQHWLNTFARWCTFNRIIISIDKCAIITFTRRNSPIIFDYSLQGINLARVSTVKDLGVTLDAKLTFNVHRSMVIAKANRQLGFIKKMSNEFSDPLCFRALYVALVRPILESACIVWAPYHELWIDRIEQVQKRFVRFALSRLYWRDPQDRTPYKERCGLLHLEPLYKRRRILQAVFVAKVLKAEIQSPSILSKLLLNAPERPLRQRPIFQQAFHRSEYGRFEPIAYLRSTFDSVIELYEFNESTDIFRSKLKASSIFDQLD